jgi:hypothetical protein
VIGGWAVNLLHHVACGHETDQYSRAISRSASQARSTSRNLSSWALLSSHGEEVPLFAGVRGSVAAPSPDGASHFARLPSRRPIAMPARSSRTPSTAWHLPAHSLGQISTRRNVAPASGSRFYPAWLAVRSPARAGRLTQPGHNRT